MPAKAADNVTLLIAVTAVVVTPNVAEDDPAAMVTVAGTEATAAFPLASDTRAPPAGTAPLRVTVPWAPPPPTTLAGLTLTADKAAAAGAACGVKRREAENGPNTPAEFAALTRHHNRCAGRPESDACDRVTVGFAASGGVSDELFATCTS